MLFRSLTFSQANVAGGGSGTGYVYSIAAGTIPAGTSLNSTTGTVSGLPTTAGSYSYTVRVTDSSLQTADTSYAVTIASSSGSLFLTAGATSGAAVSAPYSQSNVASGGSGTYTYSKASGNIPPGTSLNSSTGSVTGTPTTTGTYTYTIEVADS